MLKTSYLTTTIEQISLELEFAEQQLDRDFKNCLDYVYGKQLHDINNRTWRRWLNKPMRIEEMIVDIEDTVSICDKDAEFDFYYSKYAIYRTWRNKYKELLTWLIDYKLSISSINSVTDADWGSTSINVSLDDRATLVSIASNGFETWTRQFL